MEKISISDVIKNLRITFLYFITGCLAGVLIGFLLFFVDKTLLKKIIDLFTRRITFGLQYIGSYKVWFILNNLVVMLLMIASVIFMVTLFFRKREPIKLFKRFRRIEEKPKVTLFSLYIIPIGALLINGFLVSMLLIYVLMNFGFQNFKTLFLLMLPHGINEVLGLMLSSSLGLAYLKVLKPYILKKQWKDVRKIGKQLLLSRTTLIIAIWIVLLIIFSGFLEGSLATVVQGNPG